MPKWMNFRNSSKQPFWTPPLLIFRKSCCNFLGKADQKALFKGPKSATYFFGVKMTTTRFGTFLKIHRFGIVTRPEECGLTGTLIKGRVPKIIWKFLTAFASKRRSTPLQYYTDGLTIKHYLKCVVNYQIAACRVHLGGGGGANSGLVNNLEVVLFFLLIQLDTFSSLSTFLATSSFSSGWSSLKWWQLFTLTSSFSTLYNFYAKLCPCTSSNQCPTPSYHLHPYFLAWKYKLSCGR